MGQGVVAAHSRNLNILGIRNSSFLYIGLHADEKKSHESFNFDEGNGLHEEDIALG